MENIDFKLAGQPWEKEEDDQLIKGYNIDMLTVLELCKIHKRMPGGIISRLRRLDLIDMRHKARGYDEYEKSDLYKEICKNKQENKVKRLERKADTKKDTAEPTTQSKEIADLKNEIVSLKKDVKEMLRLMNSLYEFETQ